MPGPLRRFVGEELRHEEQWWFDLDQLSKPPYVLRFKQIPPLVGENADVTGKLRVPTLPLTHSILCVGSSGHCLDAML